MADKKKKVSPPPQKATTACETLRIDLKDIKGNDSQSRGMGVLSTLGSLGYGIFDKMPKNDDKEPIWSMLLSEKPEMQKLAVDLIEEHEQDLVNLAEGISSTGQLQAIGVRDAGKGYNVIYGMRRSLATAYNFAKGIKIDSIEGKVYKDKLSDFDLAIIALEENDNRKDESPIDRGITYQKLTKEGMTPDAIGERIRRSGQHVRDYIKLLSPKLVDKRDAIHNGDLSVDRALKLLKNRIDKGDATAEDDRKGGDKGKSGRFRMPNVNGMVKLYQAGQKPKDMNDKEWQLWIMPDVRKLLAFKLGLKYTEWVEKKEVAKEEKTEEKKPEPSGKVLKIKKDRAVQLLISIGQTQARTWDEAKLTSKLESIVNLVEPGQKAETESLQGLLDKLLTGYKEGMKVKIVNE